MSSNIRIQKICQYCGKEFIAKTTVTQHCGDNCAKLAYKARVKAGGGKLEVIKVEAVRKRPKQTKQNPIEEIKAKDFLTVPDLAKLLNCSKRTVYYLIAKGTIKAFNLSERLTLIERAEIDKLFAKPARVKEIKPPREFVESECYNVADIRKRYGISQTALRNIIIKHNIPTYYKGWFAFVPKTEIDKHLHANN